MSVAPSVTASSALLLSVRGQHGLRSAHGQCHYHGGARASRGALAPLSALPAPLRLAEPYSQSGLGGRSPRQHCPATTQKKARKDLHHGRSGRLNWLRIGFGPSAVGTEAGRG